MQIANHLQAIPAANDLLAWLSAYAKLDAMMNPEDVSLCVYHLDLSWVPDGVYIKIDDCGGDHFHLLFAPQGCIIKGFGHESDLSPYNYEGEDMPEALRGHDFYKGCPAVLRSLLDDPALEPELCTFCAWQLTGEQGWHANPTTVPENWSDGIEEFLFYAHKPEAHLEWFGEYYEQDLLEPDLRQLIQGGTITADMHRRYSL